MPRGGKRPGAGRKPNLERLRTDQMRNKAVRDGDVLPLDVMINRMRAEYHSGNYDKAVAYAVQAAPYMHPKLANVQHAGDKEQPLTFQIVTNVERDEDPAAVEEAPTLELTADPHDGSYH